MKLEHYDSVDHGNESSLNARVVEHGRLTKTVGELSYEKEIHLFLMRTVETRRRRFWGKYAQAQRIRLMLG